MATKTVTTISVRELKARASELLKKLEETQDLEFVITRHGKPCARLSPVKPGEIPWEERISLRDTWSDLPELSEEEFAQAKAAWEHGIEMGT